MLSTIPGSWRGLNFMGDTNPPLSKRGWVGGSEKGENTEKGRDEKTMGAMLSPVVMNSHGQDACYVSALWIRVGEALFLFSAPEILQLLLVLQLLLKPKFSGVEKIKTIGSTYMAAAGLSAPSGHENQVPQAHVKGNTIYRPSPVLSPSTGSVLGAEVFCGIAWRPLVGTGTPSPWVCACLQSRLHAVHWLCNPFPAGPGAEARPHWCLGGV